MYLFMYLYIYLYIYLFIHLFISVFPHFYIYLFLYFHIYFSLRLYANWVGGANISLKKDWLAGGRVANQTEANDPSIHLWTQATYECCS